LQKFTRGSQTIVSAIGLWSISAVVYPADGLAAMWPEMEQIAVPLWAVRSGVHLRRGFVPPFRAGPRNRVAGTLSGEWRPSQFFLLDMRWAYLWDSTPIGEAVQGPGDLELGAHAWAWRGPVDLGLGWRVKLPNAQDEGELGSDETDVQVLGTVAKTWSQTRVVASAGVAILGDPVRFANQDDVAIGWLGVAQELGPMVLSGQLGGFFPSPRNPARISTRFGVEGACPRLFGADFELGITPAAPVWGIGAWVGWGGGCGAGLGGGSTL
jgi:hypothetical protein